MTAWVLLTTESELPAVLAAREDNSRRDRGWWRSGDGSLAVNIRSDRGRALKSYESGGVLIVERRDLQEGIIIELQNLRERLLDVVVDAQGSDIFAQEGRLIQRRGVLIDPKQVVKLSTLPNTNNSARKIPADTLNDVLALTRHRPESMTGVFRFTAFYGAPEESRRDARIRENSPRRSYEYR